MKPLKKHSNSLPRLVATGLAMSVLGVALPAQAAVFGFIATGLSPVDDYESTYVASAFEDIALNPIDEYQASVTQAANDGTPDIDTPFEQALAAAGYNPTIIQSIIARVLDRTAGASVDPSEEDGLSLFKFDDDALTGLLSDVEASNPLSQISQFTAGTKDSSRCRRMRERYNQNPSSVPARKQAQCW